MSEAVKQPIAPSILPGEEARDQVILPHRIAFGICWRGIRARLGRSLVTLMGVGFGIAFLMSIATGFHIKASMKREDASMRRQERYANMLQGEIGPLAGRSLGVIRFESVLPDEEQFLVTLTETYGVSLRMVQEGESAPTVLVIGAADEQALANFNKANVKRFVVIPQAGRSERLVAGAIPVIPLDVTLRPDEVERAEVQAARERNRALFIVAVSLLITVIGIANAMLMSVTERFREIGTMKCLGALSGFVVKLFLIESALVGAVGSLLGVLIGFSFAVLAYGYRFGWVALFSGISGWTVLLYAGICLVAGVILAVIAGIYPARVASKMIPAMALSSNV